MRTRASVAAVIVLAVVAALFAQDRPGAPRPFPPGPEPSHDFQSDWNYAGAVQDMRRLAELGWRLANDPVMPAYNPGEQFARARK